MQKKENRIQKKVKAEQTKNKISSINDLIKFAQNSNSNSNESIIDDLNINSVEDFKRINSFIDYLLDSAIKIDKPTKENAEKIKVYQPNNTNQKHNNKKNNNKSNNKSTSKKENYLKKQRKKLHSIRFSGVVSGWWI